jgi:hypothetical protein
LTLGLGNIKQNPHVLKLQLLMRVIFFVAVVRVLILLAVVCIVVAMGIGSDFDKRLRPFGVDDKKN